MDHRDDETAVDLGAPVEPTDDAPSEVVENPTEKWRRLLHGAHAALSSGALEQAQQRADEAGRLVATIPSKELDDVIVQGKKICPEHRVLYCLFLELRAAYAQASRLAVRGEREEATRVLNPYRTYLGDASFKRLKEYFPYVGQILDLQAAMRDQLGLKST